MVQLQSLRERVAGAVNRAQKFLEQVDISNKIAEANACEDIWSSVKIHYSSIPDERFRSGIIYFKVKISNPKLKTSKGKGHVLNMIEAENIKSETSYGKPYDAICNWVHRSADKEYVMIRLSFGYDNTIYTPVALFMKIESLFKSF